MKKYEIVKLHDDFNEILNKGTKLSTKYFFLFSLPKKEYKPHFGVAVGKKLGNAVVRNKFKRQVRNIVTLHKFLFPNYHNYIIMIKKEALNASYEDLEKSLVYLLRKDKNEKK